MKILKAALIAFVAGILLTLMFGATVGGLMAVVVFAYFVFKKD